MRSIGSVGSVMNSGSFASTQKRLTSKLFTSYYRSELKTFQMQRVNQNAPKSFRESMSSVYGTTKVSGKQNPKSNMKEEEKEEVKEEVDWEHAKNTDVLAVADESTRNQAPVHFEKKKSRPYVPLGDLAKVELQGDYHIQGGMNQEALMYYGVVAKGYDLSYPENHNQRSKMAIKLGKAFRLTGRLEASKCNLERALTMLDNNERPSLELIAEALMELGLTLEEMKDTNAGRVFEDANHVVCAYHDIGENHRMLRLLPKLERRFTMAQESKFAYFSPFNFDRTFTIADQSLDFAEKYYRKTENQEGVVRVLEMRSHLIDRKFFNMRDFKGKARTKRGHWVQTRATALTNAPTPEELLKFSPTIHQVYTDFSRLLVAPMGQEDSVKPGANRKLIDDGYAYRKVNMEQLHPGRFRTGEELRSSMQNDRYRD